MSEKEISLTIRFPPVSYGWRKGFGTEYTALDGSRSIGVHTLDQLKELFEKLTLQLEGAMATLETQE